MSAFFGLVLSGLGWFVIPEASKIRPYVIGVGIVALLYAMYRAWLTEHKKVLDFESNLPDLRPEKPVICDTTFLVRSRVAAEAFNTSDPMSVLRLPIKNYGAKTEEVITHITILDDHQKELCTIEGRYADSPEPSGLARHQSIRETLLRVSFAAMETRILDIGFTDLKEGFWYPFNHESYDSLKPKARQFGPGNYVVRVNVANRRMDKTWDLPLKYEGKGKTLVTGEPIAIHAGANLVPVKG